MTPDRWQEVERLYQAARERDPAERLAFVREHCRNDDALRAEVESLLQYESQANDFIETPAGRINSKVADAVHRIRDSSAPGRFAGRVFGFYEIQAPIGAGGMGEVYRALDTRLDRVVAIKILPEPDASGLRERFKREAKIISSLNHPHVCALYDIGTADGVDYLVMEYVEGETLETRLRGGRLPLAQALEFLMQIADALDKVHRRGIVHRDLKPANVMITKSGVKLLDFGVAARVRSGAGSDSPALTAEGVVIGTLPYMAPEQLQGAPPDVRTDIFAFGLLAYEMITGQRPFEGATSAELISAILRDDAPPIESRIPGLPVPLAATIERCLAKDPDERWQSASDLLFQLRTSSASGFKRSAIRFTRTSRWLERAGWIAALAIIATLLWPRRTGELPSSRATAGVVPLRFSVLPAQGVFLSGPDVPFALSPNGRKMVYVGTSGAGVQQLWIRSLDSEEQLALAGTEGANTPFWSPDSQWVGFFAGKALKKVHVASGLTQVIATDVETFGGATWNSEDVIIFPGSRDATSRVSAKGGAVSRLEIDKGIHFSPRFLPDNKHFIYALGPGAIRVGSLDGGAPRTLTTFPVRISTLDYARGYLFYVADSTLFARALDEEKLELSGDPIRVVEGVPITNPARAPFSVSPSGVLAYWPSTLGTPAVLRWFDRQGRASDAMSAPAQYRGFALAGDGRRLIFSRLNKTGADLWLRDLGTTAETQITFEGAAVAPQWSPDGTRIAYSGYGQGPPPKLYVKNVATSGAASLVGESRLPNFACNWSPDGGTIVSVRTTDAVNRHDIWIQRVQDGASQRLPFNTRFNELQGKISPDGKWIAYTTDASGKDEVWVASFPTAQNRRQISNGGRFPDWIGTNEIVYVSDDKKLMSAPLDGASAPRALFEIPKLTDGDAFLFPTAYPYVVTDGGRRFLAAVSEPDPAAPPVHVIVNWPALLTANER